MILMLAPGAGMTFAGMPSGATYVSDSFGLVKVVNDNANDQSALQTAGCFTLTPFGSWGLLSFNLLSDLYAADTGAILPGITGYPQHVLANVSSDGGNSGTWAKTGTGHGTGNWTKVSIGSVNDITTAATTALASISTAGSTQVAAVNSAGSTEVGAVNSAGSTEVSAVNSAGAAQVAAVNTAGSTEIGVIQAQAAALGLGTPFTSLTTMLGALSDGQSAAYAQPGSPLRYTDSYLRVTGHLVRQTTQPMGAGIAWEQKRQLEAAPLGVTPLPQGIFTAQYPEDSLFVEGLCVPNRFASVPSRDRYQSPLYQGQLVTQNYATDKYGNANAAMRIMLNNTTYSYSLVFQNTSGGTLFYRTLIWVTSNVGAGSQTFAINNIPGGGTNYTVTEGTWTQIDVTLSLTNNSGIYLSRVSANADLLVTTPQVYPAEVTPSSDPSVPPVGGLIGKNTTYPGWFTLGANKTSITSAPNGRVTFGANGVAKSFSAGTFLIALKQNSAAGGVITPFCGPGASAAFALSAGPQWSVPGLIAPVANTMQGLVGRGWVVLAVSFDASVSYAYDDGVPFFPAGFAPVFGTGTGGTPASMADAILSSLGFGGSSSFPGEWGPFLCYDRRLSHHEVAQASRHIRDVLQLRGELISPRYRLLAGGDSNTGGYLLHPNQHTIYAEVAAETLGITYFNVGLLGAVLKQVPTGGTPSNTAYYQMMNFVKPMIECSSIMGDIPIYSLMIGENDIANYVIGHAAAPTASDYQLLMNIASNAGAKTVCIPTIIAGNDFNNTFPTYTAYNAALRGITANAVADLGIDALNYYKTPASFIDPPAGGHLTAAASSGIAAPILVSAIQTSIMT